VSFPGRALVIGFCMLHAGFVRLTLDSETGKVYIMFFLKKFLPKLNRWRYVY